MLTSRREFEGNDLLIYLLNRGDEEFFSISDWPLIAKLRGFENQLNQRDSTIEMLIDVIYDIEETEEFRSFLAQHLSETMARTKLELQR